MNIHMRKLSNEDLRLELKEFEERHGMLSAVFYDRFREGLEGDSDEVMHWAGLCYSAVRNGVLTTDRKPV